MDPELKAITIALNHRACQILLAGEVIVDGGILHIQCFCDVSIAETIKALLLNEGFSQIHDCAFGVGISDHYGRILLTD
jgi:hypothetical protein